MTQKEDGNDGKNQTINKVTYHDSIWMKAYVRCNLSSNGKAFNAKVKIGTNYTFGTDLS